MVLEEGEEEEREEEEEDEAGGVSEVGEDEVPEMATVALATTEEARNAASVGRLTINVPGED